MSTDKTYNGWTNYETWNVNLWLDNEEGSYRDCKERAEEFVKANFDPENPKDLDQAYGDMSKYLESMIDEFMPEVTGMFADLLGHALSRVDWYEIATHYIDDVAEDVIKELVIDSTEEE